MKVVDKTPARNTKRNATGEQPASKAGAAPTESRGGRGGRGGFAGNEGGESKYRFSRSIKVFRFELATVSCGFIC